VGATELLDAGAPRLAVDFARHHHGMRPTSIPEEVWDVLMTADQPPKAWASLRRRISSHRE
jgi:hypothetical protein